MNEKSIIPNAMQVAENIAKIIFETADKMKFEEGGDVRDLLLFGSTITGSSFKPTKTKSLQDIDMLIIHNLYRLKEFGMFTKYNTKTSQSVPDLKADIISERYQASIILEHMNYYQAQKVERIRGDIMMKLELELPSLRKKTRSYGGVIDLPFIGKISIPEQDLMNVLEYVDGIIDEKFERYVTLDKVKSYLKSQNLEVDPTLDLIVMHNDLLDPNKAYDDRQLALSQSSDPSFWYSIFTSGKLYNRLTGKFDINLDTKYSGSAELFKPV